MNGHAASQTSLSHEEKLALLEEKSASDVESESGRVDYLSSLRIRSFTTPAWLRSPSPSSLAKAGANAIRSVPWRLLLIRSLIFLVPSFLQSRITGEKRGRPERLFPTSYLDGMRGLAALFVFFCHYTYQAFIIAEGWGSKESNYHWLKLPFLRLWYQGPPMVCVFFVISGYALSLKPLKLMRSLSWDDFSNATTSLVFRRGIRLFLPTAISTLIIITLIRVGAYDWTRQFAYDRTFLKNVTEPHPERMLLLSDQLWDWAQHMWRFIHVFGWDKFGGSTSYDVHLWTIPVEFRCSLYLFLVIIATARTRTWIRLATVFGVTWFTWWHSHWELALFYCGMILAELDLIRGAHSQPTTTPQGTLSHLPVDNSPLKHPSRLKSWGWFGLSLVALYLMNQPDALGELTPGWVWLSAQIPSWWEEERYRYYQSIGSVMFVWTVGYSAGWQAFFNTAAVQYFGKISYAIYLMHTPVMHTVGYAFERWAWGVTGVEGYWYNAGFVLGTFGVVPLVIWGADIFWRLVDVPTVRFAKWAESKSWGRE